MIIAVVENTKEEPELEEDLEETVLIVPSEAPQEEAAEPVACSPELVVFIHIDVDREAVIQEKPVGRSSLSKTAVLNILGHKGSKM